MSQADFATIDQVIDQQLEAYNSRNLEKFLTFYADDIVVRKPGEGLPIADGKLQLKFRYRELFDFSPNLRAEILSRKIEGNCIVDRERITGMKGDPKPKFFLVKTWVRNGLISEVFIQPESGT
jgi:hypothetical protein